MKTTKVGLRVHRYGTETTRVLKRSQMKAVRSETHAPGAGSVCGLSVGFLFTAMSTGVQRSNSEATLDPEVLSTPTL